MNDPAMMDSAAPAADMGKGKMAELIAQLKDLVAQLEAANGAEESAEGATPEATPAEASPADQTGIPNFGAKMRGQAGI
jgi:hypothetical protein